MRKSSHQTTVTLALPAFLQSEEYLFSTLLGKTLTEKPYKKVTNNQGLGEAILFDLLTKEQSLTPAYAAISALGNGLDATTGWWLHVDPVELLVDAGNICLVGRDHLSLTEEESKQLIATLNSLLQEDNLNVIYGSPFEWYLKLPVDPKINTQPLSAVIAKDIRPYLPSGKDKGWWHKLLTEMQMLFFDHAINNNRQREGKPPVNSVWLWGEGSLRSNYTLNDYSAIWTNSSFVTGLLSHCGSSLPLFSVDEFNPKAIQAPGDYLIACNHFYSDVQFIESISGLLDNFKEGRIDRLAIYTGNGEQYHWPSGKTSLFSRIHNSFSTRIKKIFRERVR